MNNSIPHPKDPRFKNLAGQRFGRWVVLEYAGKRSKQQAYSWLCRCDCGKTKVVLGSSLRYQESQSCGCLCRDHIIKISTTHGMKKTGEWRSWSSMRTRCNNPAATGYDRYGGRGITICEQWDDFETFLKDVGPRPSPDYTLERLDNDKGYFPGNVHWATCREQANNRHGNRKITRDGVTKGISEWASQFSLSKNTLKNRLNRGWPVERLFDPPMVQKHEKNKQQFS